MTEIAKASDLLMTGSPVHPYVALPHGLTDAQWDEARKLNPGVTLLRVVPTMAVGGAPITDVVSHDVLGAWTDIVSGLLGAGASILVPGPWLPVVQTILHAGVPFVQHLLGADVRERWTLAQILQEAATPSAVPAT